MWCIESATLFGSPRGWQILAPSEHVRLETKGRDEVCCLIDLRDGRFIGYQSDPRTDATRWYLCKPRELSPSANKIMPRRAVSRSAMIDLGPSLAAILDAALDAEGAIDDQGVIAPGVKARVI